MEIYSGDEDELRPHTPMSVSDSLKDVTGKNETDHVMITETKDASFCWLCLYQGNRTTNEVMRFVVDGIAHMSLDSLVEQSKFLLDHVEPDSNSTVAEIRRHITCHVLNPKIKVALQLLELSKMQKEVSKCCVVSDAETGEKTVNTQAMRVYLTMCSQISSMYKIGEDKLIFNNSSMDK
jgi:hypothetical protein